MAKGERKSTGELDEDILHRARSAEARRRPSTEAKDEMDEVVRSILTEGERRAELRRMSPEERRRAKREAARPKFCLYFPPQLWERLTGRAEEYNCSYSNLARFGLHVGLSLYTQNDIDANEFLVPISHLRWSTKFVLAGEEGKVKVVMDITPELMEAAGKLGAEWDCSRSSAAGLLLHVFLKRVEKGELNIEGCLHPTDHPRWLAELVWPQGGIEALETI